MHQVVIGTSGWHYDSWRGPFYPANVPKRLWLSYYARHFSSTELNGVFYRTPTEDAVKTWYDQTPSDFVFAWKASKFITHWKRLEMSSRSSLSLMEGRLKLLRLKAGPILFQLPPNFTCNYERLADFLKMLPKRRQYAFEFRHKSWYVEGVYDVLRRHNAALCLSDHKDAPAPWIVSARHVYVRGHGPAGDYRNSYPDSTLQKWTDAIRKWQRQGRQVYVYFDNDQKSAAPKDAERLIKMVGKTRVAFAAHAAEIPSRKRAIKGEDLRHQI